jgi:hypothetical protein
MSWHPLLNETPLTTILAVRWNNVLTAIQSLTDGHDHNSINSKIITVSRVEVGAPPSAALARIFGKTATSRLYYYNGTLWVGVRT